MKRFKAGFLLAVLGLVACAPALDSWGDDPHGAVVQVLSGSVQVASGDLPVLSGTLYLWGKNLRVNEPSCKVVGQHVECPIPKLAPRKLYVLPVAGENVAADALVNRAEGRFWARKEMQ